VDEGGGSMLTTFDECYDNAHNYLILGALFNPRHKIIHRRFAEAKRSLGFINPDGSLREIKYALCKNGKSYKMAKSAI
jgi:hypothetical protein